MGRVYIIFAFLLMSAFSYSYGQDTLSSAQSEKGRNWSLNGYITEMPSTMFQKWTDEWTTDNLIHNRLNFKWNNRSNSLNIAVELRNRLIFGETAKNFTGYAKMIDTDNGLIKLSTNISTGKSYLLNSKIDRAYVDYTKDKFQIRVGRQRINWGQCFTWNPNDIFNAYSFFDFDYAERPGSDAVRLQYYATSASTVEFAIKADYNHKVTSAVLYRFNRWNYDIQIMGGILREEDYVLGAGWSGNILDASFRGELSYFHPTKKNSDASGVFSISLGSEYSFKNSLMIQAEVLYINNNKTITDSFADYYNMDISAKNLSFTNLSIMLQGSYPVTPIFNVSLAVMYFPKIEGFFAGPFFTYSLAENTDLSLYIQSFTGEFTEGRTDHLNMGFLRLKWNF